MIFHADSESDLKTTPNQVKNLISKSDFYGTSTLNSPYVFKLIFQFSRLNLGVATFAN